MAVSQLNITRSSGEQTATQSPQSAGQAGGTGTNSSSVQPGTATALLNSVNGVPLGGTKLSTISLNSVRTTTAASSTRPIAPVKHDANYALLAVPVLFVVIALGLFWATNRSASSAKKTT